MSTTLERRILVHAPTSKDSELTCRILHQQQIDCLACADIASLIGEMERGVGAVLLGEEVFLRADIQPIVDFVRRQPPWSDLPFMVITRQGADSPAAAEAMARLGNVILLERPTRLNALLTAVQSALRARRRQFEARDLILSREQVTRALQESEQRYRSLVEQVKDYAIYMVDLDGRAISWNEGVRRVLGFEEAEFLGTNVARIYVPEDIDGGVPERELRDAAASGAAVSDRWMRRKDDTRFWAAGVTTALIDSNGNHIGYTKVMQDLTATKKAAEALQQADRRKDEFLATLAHELRNPLAPLRHSLSILEHVVGDDPQTGRLRETMERQVNQLVRLVDDLLEVSRITRGQIELRKEPVELSDVIHTAIETSRPLIDAAGVRLSVSLPSEPITFHGDPVRLGQIFANLLNNSAKYTNAGGQIWLTARLENGLAVVEVRDSGIGIPKDMLPHVFDMFMQVDRATKRAQGGLGIGLTLVRSLVELHEGSVSVHSDGPGRGTEVTIRLPAAATKPKPAGLQDPKDPAGVLRSRRILVVDDNVDAAATLGTLLRFLGAHVQIAHDGPSALAAVEQCEPNVVLLDIGMPGMDGFEVACRIRAKDQYNRITLIALTGWGQSADHRRTREAGFDHHLVKPADIAVLKELLVSTG